MMGLLKVFLGILIIALCLSFAAQGFLAPVTTRSTRLLQLHQQPSMSMFNRFFRVVKANINSILRRWEDPEKVIEQAVVDMQNDLVRVRQSYAKISASLRRMDIQKVQNQNNADEWHRRAKLALEKGDENLAREALSRRQIQLDNALSIQKCLDMQGGAVGKLHASMIALEHKISEAKRQKESMIARARTAKTSVNVNDMLSSLGDSSSTEAFDRMKEKVENLEIQAEITEELAMNNAGTSSSVEKRFFELEGDTSVEDELKALRSQIHGKRESFAHLPSVIDTKQDDQEYEQIKREIGRKY